jgi:hypothetical protein
LESEEKFGSKSGLLRVLGFDWKSRPPAISKKAERIRLRGLLTEDLKKAIITSRQQIYSQPSAYPDKASVARMLFGNISANISRNTFYRRVSETVLRRWMYDGTIYDIVNEAGTGAAREIRKSTRLGRVLGMDTSGWAPAGGNVVLKPTMNETAGLLATALINNSAYDRFKFRNYTEDMDYLGAFLGPGKRLVARGGTGNKFGFERSPHSVAYADRLIDMTKKPGLLNSLLRNLGKGMKTASKIVFGELATVGGVQLLLYYIAPQSIFQAVYNAFNSSMGPPSNIIPFEIISGAFLLAYPIYTLLGIGDGWAEYKHALNLYKHRRSA